MNASTDLTAFLDSQYRKYYDCLLALADQYLSDLLRKRYSPEDIVQSTFVRVLEHPDYIISHAEVPAFFKWRTQLFHTLSNINHRNLNFKRDAEREITFSRVFEDSSPDPELLDRLRKSETSPRSRIEQRELAEAVLESLGELSPEERRIITLRQFDRYTAPQCAELLDIPLKEVNACYIRAIRHMKRKLESRPDLRADHV